MPRQEKEDGSKPFGTVQVTYHPAQLEVFDNPAQHIVYVKGRRAGGTNGAVCKLIELASEFPGSAHFWLDTTVPNIQKLFIRLIQPLLKNIDYTWSNDHLLLKFPNNSFVQFASAYQGTNLEGFGYRFFWINEAGLVLRNPNIWENTVLPMSLESENPRFFFIGAPKGPGQFEAFFNLGQGQDKDWFSVRHSSFVNPLLNRDLLNRLSSRMSLSAYRQEILAEFTQPEAAVFQHPQDAFKQIPMISQAPDLVSQYVIGLDLARKHDRTALWVLDAESRRGVFADDWRGVPWSAQLTKLRGIAKKFNNPPFYVDATGLGDPFVEAMQASGLIALPIILTNGRKARLVESLMLLIESGDLVLPHHQETLDELTTFERETTQSGLTRYAGASGTFDDYVIALCLAVLGISTSSTGGFFYGDSLIVDPDGILI